MQSVSNVSHVPTHSGLLYESWPQADGSVKITLLTEGAEEFLQSTEAEINQQFNSRTIPIEGIDPADFYRKAEASIANHSGWTMEFGYRRPRDGTLLWLRAQDFPRRTPDGRTYFTGVVIDTTDLKRSEETALRAHHIQHAHMDNTPLAVIEWDADFKLVRWNSRAETIFGWKAEEVLGKHPREWQIVHADDVERVDGIIQRLLTQEDRGNFCKNRNYCKDGTVLFCEWHNSAVFDEQGKLTSVLSLAQDLTEQLRTQRDLKLSEKRLSDALKAANMICWEHDVRTNTTHYTRNFGEFFRMPELPHQPTVEQQHLALHPEDCATTLKAYTDALAGDGNLQAEFRGATPDEQGRTRYFQVRAELRSNPDGTPDRFLGITWDITQRKQEEEVRRLLAEELFEARHYQSLTILAGGISHELNNLLTVILANAAFLEKSYGELDPYLESVHSIVTNTERAAELCRQLTAYAGAGRLYLQDIAVMPFLNNNEAAIQTAAGQHEVQYQCDEDLPLIHVEPYQFRQIILNLVTNASEAYGERIGSIGIAVGSHTLSCAEPSTTQILHPGPGEYVFIRISDDAGGIPPHKLQSVFEPFVTSKRTQKGLGLAAVVGVVRAEKGGVFIHSELGHGTTIELHFPIPQTSENSLSSTSITSQYYPHPSTDSAPHQGKCLVVDDELNICELIAQSLEMQGFKVATAGNGADALKMFNQDPFEFSCVVLDVTLPGLPGDVLLQKMREEHTRLPALIITGHVDHLLNEQFGKDAHTRILLKPFRMDALVETVCELLRIES